MLTKILLTAFLFVPAFAANPASTDACCDCTKCAQSCSACCGDNCKACCTGGGCTAKCCK